MLWRKIYAGNKVGANFSQANQTARKKPRRNNSSTDKSSMRVSRKYLLRHHENCFYCSNVMIADFKHVFAHRFMNVNTRLAKHGNGNGQPNKVCSECSHEGDHENKFSGRKNWEREQRSYVRWGAWFVTHPQKLILRRLFNLI